MDFIDKTIPTDNLKQLSKALHTSYEFLQNVNKQKAVPSDYLILKMSSAMNIAENELFKRFKKNPIMTAEEYRKNELLTDTIMLIEKSKQKEAVKQQLYDAVFSIAKGKIPKSKD